MRRRLLALALGLLAGTASGQRLSIARYGAAEGLPSGRVNTLLQDGHGYLWVGTWEGLARFDGERFETFGRREGLENPLVATVALDPAGGLWAGTYAGLARLVEEGEGGPGGAAFELVTLGADVHSNQVSGIRFEDAESAWCGTSGGLFHVRIDERGHAQPELALPESVSWASCFVREPGGALWCATSGGLVRLERGAVVERVEEVPDGAGSVIAFVPRPDGSTLIVSARAVRLARAGKLGQPGSWEQMPLELPGEAQARCALLDADGVLWIGTNRGLLEWKDGVLRQLGVADGVSEDIVLALCEDRDRNLWIGTSAQGLECLTTRAIASWTVESGLPSPNVVWTRAARDGSIVLSTMRGIAVVRAGRLEVLASPRGEFVPGHSLRQDHAGDWWMIDRGRPYFLPGPELDLARAQELGARHGLPEGTAYGELFEDSAGALWISTVPRFVSRRVGDVDGEPRFETSEIAAPPGVESAPRTMLELPNGDVWLAPFRGLWRRRGGTTEPLDLFGDGRDIDVREMLIDSHGTLWIGTRFDGALRVDDPLVEEPRCAPVASREELQSQAVFALAEDSGGRIWFGTGRGLDRLESDGRLVHYGTAEGLAGEIVHDLYADGAGALWAATSGGLSRIDLTLPDPVPAPAAVRFTSVRVAGVAQPLPPRGAGELDLGELSAAQDDVLLEFTAPCLRRERELAFEYRLGPRADWILLGARRSLSFARLAAGNYEVHVRARRESGGAGLEAVVRFEVEPPFWRTGWFAAAVLVALGGLGWSVHRARVARLLALERVRSQIASDVHDELGSGLAQIAVLTEVARRDVNEASGARLSEVARLARTLRESMSEIVWAVDPRQDSFKSLADRLRPLAHNLFEGDGVRVEFAVPADEELARVRLAPDRRRQLFLLLKEALTNAARHARAEHVRVELTCSGRRVRARVRDDGAGFDPERPSAGHGLAGMRRRARELGATLLIRSRPGEGTELELELDAARP